MRNGSFASRRPPSRGNSLRLLVANNAMNPLGASPLAAPALSADFSIGDDSMDAILGAGQDALTELDGATSGGGDEGAGAALATAPTSEKSASGHGRKVIIHRPANGSDSKGASGAWCTGGRSSSRSQSPNCELRHSREPQPLSAKESQELHGLQVSESIGQNRMSVLYIFAALCGKTLPS